MVPVLMYHHIAPVAGPHTVTVANFRDQLAFLRARKIRALTLAEFDAWHAGKLKIDGRAVLLTFDDAWLDNWAWALPLLQEFGVPAVFFVVTSWPGAGEPRWNIVQGGSNWQASDHNACMRISGTSEQDTVSMRWSELLAARDTGLVELASHSHSHGAWWQLNGEWSDTLDAARDDLEASAIALEKRTGKRPTSLCWPKGFFTQGLSGVARGQGFQKQFTTLRGGNSPNGPDMIRRINVEDHPASWLEQRLKVYSSAVAAPVLGLMHQNLHRVRMRKRFRKAPGEEFAFPVLRTL